MGLSVLETEPLQPIKFDLEEGTAVNLITLPELYSVVDFPADMISSETVPEPVIERVRGYFLFSKLDVIVLDSFTVSSMGFSVLETEPDHPVNIHSSDGFAVNLITLPELYSVVVFPVDMISSETVPEPVIETVRGYFLFSKISCNRLIRIYGY